MANCNGCLKEGVKGFCSACERKLFDRSKVPVVLNFNWEDIKDKLIGHPQMFSVSGMQPKGFIGRDKNKLLTQNRDLESMYIIKPPLDSYRTRHADSPANEHLTMTIAEEEFGISTARCAYMNFQNGTPAYLTRRFDRDEKKQKLRQEDFVSVLGINPNSQSGGFYKYASSSYEEVGMRLITADQIRFLKLLLFNFVSGNGDVHLKNISLLESPQGDMLLSPAYDLMNTKLHVQDPPTAMNLFKERERGQDFRNPYSYKISDFEELGKRWSLSEPLLNSITKEIESKQSVFKLYVRRSFLSDEGKTTYLNIVDNNYKQLFS